jgi:uncharacterized protein YuzE
MKIRYDPSVDAVYIELVARGPGSVERTVHVTDGIGVDLGFDGRALGIEILDAREQLGLAQGRLDVSLEQAAIAAAAADRRG